MHQYSMFHFAGENLQHGNCKIKSLLRINGIYTLTVTTQPATQLPPSYLPAGLPE